MYNSQIKTKTNETSHTLSPLSPGGPGGPGGPRVPLEEKGKRIRSGENVTAKEKYV